MFGDTPTGILVLDIVLVLMGAILSPLLWGIFTRLGGITSSLTKCVQMQLEAQTVLAEVVRELNDARVRDKDLEGRVKIVNEKLDNHIRDDKK